MHRTEIDHAATGPRRHRLSLAPLACAALLLTGGCGVLTAAEEGGEAGVLIIEDIAIDEDGREQITRVDTSPTTPKRPIPADLPQGWTLRTYGSTAGSCVEADPPGKSPEVYCAAASGLDHRQTTGIHLNTTMWRTSEGMIHLGLAAPQITRVAIVHEGRTLAETATHPTAGSSVRAFLIAAPGDLDQYDLIGIDADGCVRHDETIDLIGDDSILPGSRPVDCG